jgi:hypothetical protein
MLSRASNHHQNLSPVNTWPWRGWQGIGAAAAYKER